VVHRPAGLHPLSSQRHGLPQQRKSTRADDAAGQWRPAYSVDVGGTEDRQQDGRVSGHREAGPEGRGGAHLVRVPERSEPELAYRVRLNGRGYHVSCRLIVHDIELGIGGRVTHPRIGRVSYPCAPIGCGTFMRSRAYHLTGSTALPLT